jgi:D-lyxose ketol-isomerase
MRYNKTVIKSDYFGRKLMMSKLDFKSSDFYKDGMFDEAKAKEAIVELCRHHGCPIFPKMPDGIWVSDYGLGDFLKVGLSALGFVNHTGADGMYMMQDLYLLPGQMLPEHWHEDYEKRMLPIKNEGWLIRYGKSYVVGEGEDNLEESIKIPNIHHNGTVTVKHGVWATPGMFIPLARLTTRHWQIAGPEGAIMTEVANAHDNAAVRHTDSRANESFLAGI